MPERPSQPPIEIRENKPEETPVIETVKEHIPSREELQAIFDQLIPPGVERRNETILEDEDGIYSWNVEITEELGETRLEYLRKGAPSEGSTQVSSIYAVYLSDDGEECGGRGPLAIYRNGAWQIKE